MLVASTGPYLLKLLVSNIENKGFEFPVCTHINFKIMDFVSPKYFHKAKVNTNRAFSPLVIVGMASPILVAMVTVFYIMKE